MEWFKNLDLAEKVSTKKKIMCGKILKLGKKEKVLQKYKEVFTCCSY